jgi:hypothetical protein
VSAGQSSRANLSVIVVFFNMRREACRTLRSLSRGYQRLDAAHCYEVLAIDNGSAEPLSPDLVKSFGREFSYRYVPTKDPSPCRTINRLIDDCRFENVMVLIDGARLLSPGVMRLTFAALRALEHPFVYTLSMHIGQKAQNYLVSEGYDSSTEDELFKSIDWPQNGYSLFSISSVALSSGHGFFSKLRESNCFALRREDFIKAGLYESRFQSPGGGLCNLELFNRLNSLDWLQPVMLLGEASFHQFHGGIATNVPIERHPWNAMEKEYATIVGARYESVPRRPIYLGEFHQECAQLYTT